MIILCHILITYFAVNVTSVHDKHKPGNNEYVLCIIQIEIQMIQFKNHKREINIFLGRLASLLYLGHCVPYIFFL